MKIELTSDTIKKYGRPCGRTEVRAIDDGGEERGFAWAEQNYSDADLWTAYRWSDLVGPVVLRSPLTKDEAIAEARRHVSVESLRKRLAMEARS